MLSGNELGRSKKDLYRGHGTPCPLLALSEAGPVGNHAAGASEVGRRIHFQVV